MRTQISFLPVLQVSASCILNGLQPFASAPKVGVAAELS